MKYPIFIFISVCVLSRESVCLREHVNTEFVWELKRGIEKKVSVRRAVRLRECPLSSRNSRMEEDCVKTRPH